MNRDHFPCAHPDPIANGSLYSLGRDDLIGHVAALDLSACCAEWAYGHHLMRNDFGSAYGRLTDAMRARQTAIAIRFEAGM